MSSNGNQKGSRATNLDDYRRINAKRTNILKFGDISSIYILEILHQDIYKIGVSNKPDRRIRDIQSVLPYESKCLFKLKVNKAYDLESIIHNQYIDLSVKGEWFKLSKSQVIEIITKVKEWGV